jgi:hypothetical protein
MTASRKYCQKKAASCLPLLDVVVSGVLAERRFVPTDKRLEIMKQTRDWRPEVVREVKRIQGALALDFRLHMGSADDSATLAKWVDAYCLSSADQTSIPWQACAASLVWFIGGEGK